MAKSTKQTREKKSGTIRKVIAFLKNEKFRYSLGALFLFFALFLIIAFVSYLFTWQIDQSKLDITWSKLISNADISVDNWAGKTGALLSHRFIHKWFGVASFSFVFILIIIGLRLFGLRFLPVGKSLKYTIIIAVWVSFTLGYFFGQKYFFLGGAHGYYLSKWFTSFAGNIGTVLLIIITAFIFVLFSFENSLSWFKNLFSFSKDTTADEEFSDETNNEIIATDIENDVSDPDESEIIANDDLNDTTDSATRNEQGSVLFETVKMQGNDSDQPEDNDDIPGEEDGIEFTSENSQEDDSSGSIKYEHLGDYDPTLDLSFFEFPPIDLLVDHKSSNSEVTEEELNSNKDKIVDTLQNYNIKIDKIKATIGPTVTLYEIVPAPGVRISKIKNLEDDIALSLSALGIRIIAPIPGKGTIGIEVPNQNPEVVSMKSILSSKKFQESTFELPIVLGKTISNEVYCFDLTKMPHLLVAGATGQGKSVGLNAIITSLLYKKHPSQLKFVMVDPKKVELTLYSKIEKHYLAKLPSEDEAIITDIQKVVDTLNSLTKEMDSRYDLLKKAQLRNLKEYNDKFIKRRLNPEDGHKFMPYIVVIVDEFADLIMTAGKEIEAPIARIAQLARAVGIHLIIATQRPSANIITGMIKANFPARIAFKVVSMIDSRTILDSSGANQLIGRGDMLFLQGSTMTRIQCAFVDTPEVEEICKFISGQQSYPSAFELPEPDRESGEGTLDVDLSQKDALFEEAARLVVLHQQGSTSLIQRKFAIGYNRAGRIIDQLEAAGIVGPFEGSKARQVLFVDEYALEQFLNNLDKN
ncbi:MAG: DNA translocase FtsK [Bacteroidota bacterium]